ncbi:MarR family winged helix-turn-helix transcriptional regulator [Granulosicoccus antarcticus]|uniref:Organic hydroperoxide resistance transcriptional regulator n=1 Tax=Granulosicoccus antarcticus IMCC3135 TaxID=1192854 RepID=A0A2Z2NTE3_9GAMM|nr:MarR family transcriptional regulator [Granulosicoccus antarcticus]ASJ70877.1 Organic hydroperoxide resistance transcriptional regulator [Granulosicoccus antarcticus IMCC3135]
MTANTNRPSVTDKEGELRIEEQVCFSLYSLSRAFTKQYSILLKKLGITYPQYLAMMVLWQGDGLSIQEMADHIELEQATATPLIQRLEKLGLVSRVRSTADERRVEVFLTSKGRALFKKARDIPRQMGCATDLSESNAKKLIKQTNKIKTFIKENN